MALLDGLIRQLFWPFEQKRFSFRKNLADTASQTESRPCGAARRRSARCLHRAGCRARARTLTRRPCGPPPFVRCFRLSYPAIMAPRARTGPHPAVATPRLVPIEASLERSPIDNLDMNETGIGGWGGQFHDQSFHARQCPLVIISQSSATLVPHILAGCKPSWGCPARE